MEKLNQKYETLIRALETLETALRNFKAIQNGVSTGGIDYHEALESHRDSVIQRFEYSFELCWKYLSVYLQEKYEIIPQVYSPSGVFRTACHTKILSEEQTNQAMNMVQDRNKTSHIYKQEIADYVAASTPRYFKLMQEITHTLQP